MATFPCEMFEQKETDDQRVEDRLLRIKEELIEELRLNTKQSSAKKHE